VGESEISGGSISATNKRTAKDRRRAKGEGSIVQRADGTWQYSIDLGKNAEGKRQRRYIYATTKSELQRKVFDLRAKGGGTIRPRAKGTVAEWVGQWLEQDVRPNRSRNTYVLYETMWRVHAAPAIAQLPLERLEPTHVAELYARLRSNGTSSTLIHRVGLTMHRAIAVATRRGLFHRANPFALVDRPTPRPKAGHDLTIEEARRFLEAAQGDRLEALFVLLITAGLRLGEALAIEWRDVDFERGRLLIRQALTEVNGTVELGPPKTPGSKRAVELGALAIAALRRRRELATSEGHGSKLVFSTSSGTPLRRSNVRRSHYEPILKGAGIPHFTIHGLRHAMTSFGIASGIAPKILAERLGHSTVRLTQDRYAHVLPGMQREAAEAIDELLR
jgi:integrase